MHISKPGEYSRAREKNYCQKYPERYLLKSAKQRARIYGLEFDITEEDIIIPDRCPIRDVQFDLVRSGFKNRNNVPSLDRKDNTLGYVKGNVFVISWLANKFKANMTRKEITQLNDYVSS